LAGSVSFSGIQSGDPVIGVGSSWILELNDYQQFLTNNFLKL